MRESKQVSEKQEAKAYAAYAKKMHRQLLKVGSDIEALEETLAFIQSRKERRAMNKRVQAFMAANLRENLLSRKAKEFGSALEVSAVDMQAALFHAQAAIAAYVSTWNETLDAAHTAKAKSIRA
jgi:CRISPR/Cas system CMR-associated protein Cmr5 small subunit